MRHGRDQALRQIAIIVFAWLALVGCVSELRLYPAPPPGRVVTDRNGNEAVEIESQGIRVLISKVKLWDAGALNQQFPGIQADLVIENNTGSWGIVVRIKSISFSIDSAPLTLWPYIAVISSEGTAGEMDNVEELLVMQGAPTHLTVALKGCSLQPGCVPRDNVTRLMVVPSVEAVFQIAEMQIIKRDMAISLGARFVPRMWDRFRFGLRRLISL